MSGDIEINKCDFCHEIKQVERTYLHPSKYVKGDYFINIKTCAECGIPTSSQTEISAVQWIINKIESVKPTDFCSIEKIKEWCEQAKVIESEQQQKMVDDALTNYELGWADRKKSSQTEISDEEIENQSDKQTSIEWLIKELKLEGYDHTIKVAKKMYDKEIDECSKKHSIQKINPSDFIDEMFKNAGRRD